MGIIDSDRYRVQHPEGFFWNCCGHRGDEESACVMGFHLAVSAPKRGRFDDPASPPEVVDDGEDWDDDEDDEGVGGPLSLNHAAWVEEEEEDPDEDDGEEDEEEEDEEEEEEEEEEADEGDAEEDADDNGEEDGEDETGE